MSTRIQEAETVTVQKQTPSSSQEKYGGVFSGYSGILITPKQR